MDPLLSFKKEVQNMFEGSFNELQQKNNLNKTILSNLMEAAQQQSNRIGKLENNIQNLKKQGTPDPTKLKAQIQKREEKMYQNFDQLMERLSTIEEGIKGTRISMEHNLKTNRDSERTMECLIGELQRIERQENIGDYSGDRNQLYKEIQELQRILSEEKERERNMTANVQFQKKIIPEPIHTFETKIALHNKSNEEILRTRLHQFTEKIRNLQARIGQASGIISSQMEKAGSEQKKAVQEMMEMEGEMRNLKLQLEQSDAKRKHNMQVNAAKLDVMVQEMLVQARKLQARVQMLRKGYTQQRQKVKMQ